jgi:phosphoserine phosphatase RsbU/P
MTDDALDEFCAALLDDDPVALYERAPCGYLSTTPDGTIIKVNQTFLLWTGYDRSTLVGRQRFADLLTAGGRIYHETHYAPMLRMQGAARQIALDLVCADGTRLPALVNAVLERDDAGNPVVVRAAIFDATDRREYERELLRAKEAAEESEQLARQLATTLQQTLLPPALPDIPGVEISAVYRPARNGGEVGGDFYDVFELGGGEWAVAVGDVRGKGVEAAVVAALVRHTIRAAAVQEHEPSDVLRVVNHVLLRDATDRFCTAAVVLLGRSGSGWTARSASAGHPLPLLVRADGVVQPAGGPGTLLGVFAELDIAEASFDLGVGDAVVLYTDGVTEARRGSDFFGEERLAAAAAAHRSDRNPSAAVVAEVSAFGARGPSDDIVVVSLRVAP